MVRPILNLDDFNLSDLDDTQIDSDYDTRDEAEGSSNAVAIIGLDGRVGSANNLNELWELLVNEREGMRWLPENRRQDVESFLKAKGVPLPLPESQYFRSTFLTDVASFDPNFFGISKQEANFMDPNQRMFLETAWKAIEDAGYGGEDIRGTDMGIFVGFSSDFGENYRHIINVLSPDVPEVAVAGNVKSIIASRLAYHLDLKGPALMVDTACSSGLLAMYLAFRAIQNGECSMALVGAVKSELLPILSDGKSDVGISDIKDTHSSEGHTRTFDNASDGTMAAEGTFAFVLKSLEQAERDGDSVRAVILGGAANQDGASVGITAPNSQAQEELIVRALEDAGISAEKLSYIEAHGTATKLGDPIEISGIQKAIRHFTTKKQFCAIGSLKTNIGHLDNAAGLGGVAKLVLSMKHRILPASLNFNVPNRNISFIESPVYVNDQTTVWSNDPNEELVAGINSFGLSGTNCHLVLKSPSTKQRLRTKGEQQGPLLLPLSAKTPQALKILAAEYKEFLADSNVDLADAVFTASRGRLHHHIRMAVCFETREQLCSALGNFVAGGADNFSDCILRYGEHRIIENKNKRRHSSAITEIERQHLTNEAVSYVSNHSGRPSINVLEKLANLYVVGAELPWDYLTKGLEVSRISLPTYPFQRTYCWVEAKVGILKAQTHDVHPLLGDEMQQTIGHTLFKKNFLSEENWEMKEHRIKGKNILPGTAFLEMMVEGVKRLNRQKEVNTLYCFKNIMFLQPFTVEDGTAKELHMLVEDENTDKRLRFASYSNLGVWEVHAEAVLHNETIKSTSVGNRVDVNALLGRVNQPIPLDKTDDVSRGLQLGDRWYDSFLGGWMEESKEEFLIELKLPQSYAAEAKSYNLHPAIMDMGLNAVNNLMGEGELYLPLSYGEMLVYQQLPSHVYVHLQKTDGQLGAPIQRFNINVYETTGNIVLQINNYCIKSASEALEKQNITRLYGYKRIFSPLSLPSEAEIPPGRIVVAGKHTVTSSALVKSLRENGHQVLELTLNGDGDTWEKALAPLTVHEELAAVIFTWEPPAHLGNNPEGWKMETCEAVMQGFRFLKAWMIAKYKTASGVILLTQQSCSVKGNEDNLHPGQAALGGLWRVAALEFESLKLRCIDHDEQTTIETLLNEIAKKDRPTFLAYRNEEAYIIENEKSPIPIGSVKELNDDEGVIIISGGTGDLGMELANHLSTMRGRKLVLLGHQPIPARDSWLNLLEESKDEVLTYRIRRWLALEKELEILDIRSVRIDDFAQLSSVLSELRSRYGKIRGIFHLAGRPGEGYLFQKEEETFQRVYLPKAKGATNLHLATLEDKLEFFIVFSSISSLLLNPGQSDYVSANMFLDTLAEVRHEMGLPALSIQWPAWRETGIAKRMGAVDEEEFFAPMGTGEALSILERIFWNLDKLPPVIMPGLKNNRYSNELNLDKKQEMNDQHKLKHTSLLGMIEPDEVDLAVTGIWGKTLALEEVDADDEFNYLGGNSLLTSQMLKEYENLYPGIIDIADLFTHTTVREQAEYLKSRLRHPAHVATTSDTPLRKEEIKNIKMATEQDLDELLELVSRGELTVEDSSTRISFERRKKR